MAYPVGRPPRDRTPDSPPTLVWQYGPPFTGTPLTGTHPCGIPPTQQVPP
jgi:hypothetical protein